MPTLAVSAPSFEWSSHKEMFSLTPQSCQHHDDWEAYCPRLLVCQVWTLDVLFRTPPHLQESSATSVRIERVTVAQPTVWQGATAYPSKYAQVLLYKIRTSRSDPCPTCKKSSATSVCIVRVTVAQPTVWQGATAYSNAHENNLTTKATCKCFFEEAITRNCVTQPCLSN